MKTVGIYLHEPIFTHGQLYVALSWATCVNDVFVFYSNGRTTINVVYTKLLRWSFFFYLLPAFLSRWVGIPTSKSQVEIPYIGCKNDCNGNYVHNMWLLKTECFLNSYCPIKWKLSQLKIVN
jgi:hypothetical protein